MVPYPGLYPLSFSLLMPEGMGKYCLFKGILVDAKDLLALHLSLLSAVIFKNEMAARES